MAYKRLSTSFRFKNVEQHLLLGSGGNQNLRPSGRRPPTRTFHPPPVGTLRRDAPALVRVCSPNDGNLIISFCGYNDPVHKLITDTIFSYSCICRLYRLICISITKIFQYYLCENKSMCYKLYANVCSECATF